MVKKLIVLSSVFGLLFFGMTVKAWADAPRQGITAVAPSPAGLVAHYEFEGDAKDSARTNHGTEYGNPTYGAGVFGQAINLDGDGDYVNCGNKSSFELTNQITVAAWITVNTFDKKYQAVITKGDNSWRLARASGSNNIEFACNGTAATRWTGWGEVPWGVSGTTSVNDGKWHHIAGVFDGAGLFLYIDGVLEAAKGAANSIDISNHNVCIGANAQAPGREWNGLIDDVRIYNYALSQAEIVSVMGKSEIDVPSSLPATLYDIAKRYDKLKKFEEAKGVCQLILQRHPESPYASNAQIYISKRNILSLIQSKKYTAVQPAVDKLIADFGNHPDLSGALYAIAGRHSNARKFKEAETIYREIIQRFPNDPYAVKSQFNAPKIHIFYLIASGNYGEVQTAIDKFVADFLDNPDVPGVIYWFGKELEALKRYQDAKLVYQRVEQKYPDNPHVPKAEVRVPKMDILALIESGNDSAAWTAVDSLIYDFRDNPDLSESVFNIGEQYYIQALSYEAQGLRAEAGDYFRKALVIWEKMITQLPSSSAYVPHAYYFSGFCYGRLDDFAKAAQYYQNVVDNWPKFEFAWSALFQIGRDCEELQKSGLMSESEVNPIIRAVYKQLLEQYPTCKAARHARRWLSRHGSK